jgi:glycosyltransferase involved in cell wall biosynthesis
MRAPVADGCKHWGHGEHNSRDKRSAPHTVAMIQPYIPAYRVQFLLELQEALRPHDVNLIIAVGDSPGPHRIRRDAVALKGLVQLPELQFRLGSRRLKWRRLGALKADLVILEQAAGNLEGYPLLLGRRRRAPRIGLWGHGAMYVKPISQLEQRFRTWLTKKTDFFFAYTDAGADYLAQHGFPRDRITVVRNATDTYALRQSVDRVIDSQVASFSAINGLSPGFTALFVGALDDTKRLDFLLRAVDRIASEFPWFRLLVVGRGAEESKIVAAQRGGTAVTFLGHRRGDCLAIVARASEVILMPGRVGLVAVDSFALGLPIVTTDWPHHAPEFDYLSSSDSVITEDSVIAYADSVVALLADQDRRRALQENCRKRATEFTVECMADRFCHGIVAALSRGSKDKK